MKNSKFAQWINIEFAPITKSLPIYRVIYALFALFVVLPKYLWIGSYPDTFFLPRIGFTLFFSGFPDVAFFYLLNFLMILSLLALLVGYKTFYSSITFAVLFFIGNGWAYSFGKVNHDILFLLTPLLLSGIWGGNLLARKNSTKKASTWPIPTFALLISLAMLTAAIPKIISGWLDPSTSALTGHLVKSYFVSERQTITAGYLLSQNNFYLFKLFDYGTIIIESAFIFALVSLRHFRLVCALACFFHFGVHLTMGISFTTNIMAYAVFVNWNYLYNFDRLKKWLANIDAHFNKVGFLKLALATIPIWLFYIYFEWSLDFNLGLTHILGGNIIDTCIMIAAVTISVVYLYNILNDSIKSYGYEPFILNRDND